MRYAIKRFEFEIKKKVGNIVIRIYKQGEFCTDITIGETIDNKLCVWFERRKWIELGDFYKILELKEEE